MTHQTPKNMLKGMLPCNATLGGILTGLYFSMLQRNRDQVTLMEHTLLRLIGGSGVDWSQDKELCELVVKLGQRSIDL